MKARFNYGSKNYRNITSGYGEEGSIFLTLVLRRRLTICSLNGYGVKWAYFLTSVERGELLLTLVMGNFAHFGCRENKK